MKNGSLVQSVSTEKRKLKSGVVLNNLWKKAKLDEGSRFDSEIKRKKHDKQDRIKM